jgi:hypothetical protein
LLAVRLPAGLAAGLAAVTWLVLARLARLTVGLLAAARL